MAAMPRTFRFLQTAAPYENLRRTPALRITFRENGGTWAGKTTQNGHSFYEPTCTREMGCL
jgi:hypothetical protein